MENQVLVLKGLSNNYELSKYGTTVYLALRSIINNYNISNQYITVDTLIYALTGEIDDNTNRFWNKSLKQNLVKGMNELNETDLITIVKSNKVGWVIDADKLATIQTDNNYGERFEMLSSNQIWDMFNKYGFDIINYLFKFMGAIYDTSKFENGNMFLLNTRKDMAEEFNVDVKTFDKYNNILEELGIIYIYRYDCRFTNSGKTPMNMYGMNDELVIDAMNMSADKLIKEHEMTKGVVVKGKTKAELSSKKEDMEQWLDMLEQAYIDDKPVVIKRGFYNKKGERITTKKRAIIEPQNKPQSTIQVKPKSCEHNIIQLNVSQNSDTESLTFNERLEHYKEIGELF